MHLFIVTEGVKMWLDKFVNDLQAVWCKTPDGKQGYNKIMLGVREVKILDLVFPAECEEQVLATLAPYELDDKPITMKIGEEIVRKIGKLDPVKSGIKSNGEVYRPFIRVIAVGTKKDEIHESGKELL